MTFEFHPKALLEYETAGNWYEEQRSRLGVEFTAAIDKAVGAILQGPGKYRLGRGGIHIFRLTRFPYHILYRYDEAREHVRILAIAHFKRKPDYWRDRL